MMIANLSCNYRETVKMWLIRRVLYWCWLWWICLQFSLIGPLFVECSKEITSNTVTDGLETSGCSPIGIMVEIPAVTDTHDHENTIPEKQDVLNKMFPTPTIPNEPKVQPSNEPYKPENQNDNGIISVKLTKSQNKNVPKKHESGGLFQEIYIKSNGGMKSNGQNSNTDYKSVQDLRILIENDGVKTSIKPLKESHKSNDDNTKQNDKRILSKNQELLKVLNTLLKRKQKLSENKLLNLDSDYVSNEYNDDDHDHYKQINSKENENYRHKPNEDIQGKRNKNLNRNLHKSGFYASVERDYLSKENDRKDKKFGNMDSFNLNLNLARYIEQEMKKLQKLEAECRLEETKAVMRAIEPTEFKSKYQRDFENYPTYSKKHSSPIISGEKFKKDKKIANSRDSCFDDHNDPSAKPCENRTDNEKNLSSPSYYEYASHPYLEYGSEHLKFDHAHSRRSGKRDKSKGNKNRNIEENEEIDEEDEEEDDQKLKKFSKGKSRKNQNKNNLQSKKNKKVKKEDYQDYEYEDEEENKRYKNKKRGEKDSLEERENVDEIDEEVSEEYDYTEEDSREDVMKRSYSTRKRNKKQKENKKDENKEIENDLEEEDQKEVNKCTKKKSRNGHKEGKRCSDKSREDSQEKIYERNRNKFKGSKRNRNTQKKDKYENEQEEYEERDMSENKNNKRRGNRYGNEEDISKEINNSSEEEKLKNAGKKNKRNKGENGRSRKQRRQVNLTHLKIDSHKKQFQETNQKSNDRTKRAVIYSVENQEWVKKTIPTQQNTIEWTNPHPQVITSTGDIIAPHAEINYATHTLPSSNEQYAVNNPQLNWHEVKRLLNKDDNQQVKKVPNYDDDLSRKIYKLLRYRNREQLIRPVESDEEYSSSSEEIQQPIIRYPTAYAKPVNTHNFRLRNYLKNLKGEPKEVIDNRSVEHVTENENTYQPTPKYYEATNENQEPTAIVTSSVEEKKDEISNPKDCIKFKPIKRGRFRIPLKLVEDEKGNYFLEIDVKYFCRSCNKRRTKIKNIKLESTENRN